MSNLPRIFAFHLLNDRSGSPKVLGQILKKCVKDGRDVNLYTSAHANGFLSEIKGITYHKGWYVFQPNPWLRLIYFTLSQILLIIKMWSKIGKNDIVYINTVLPFGAGILGKIKGARIIYHIHETTVNPAVLKWFLFKMVKVTAHEIINVSKYVEQAHQIKSVPNHLVYNSLENAYLDKILPKKTSFYPKNVLMVCSLKKYKGVYEFLQLATDHPQYAFRLVLNGSQSEINTFFSNHHIPLNLTLFAAQKDLHPFYQWADVILNLSRPDGWIETFGLTIIEGMAYGLPAIVPPVGGILEVIEDGVTGFAVDARDRQNLNLVLNKILSNSHDYVQMSIAAKERVNMFKEDQMIQLLDRIL